MISPLKLLFFSYRLVSFVSSSFRPALFRPIVLMCGVISLFCLFAWRFLIVLSFRMASFRSVVFFPGLIMSFRLAFFVILSFSLASFRYSVFSPGVASSYRGVFFVICFCSFLHAPYTEHKKELRSL